MISGVRRAKGVQGWRVTIQTDYPTEYVEHRVHMLLANCQVSSPTNQNRGGGPWSFCLAISQGDRKFYFFSPQDRLYFHRALWPFIYVTHFLHKKYIFPKKLEAPSILMLAPLFLCIFSGRYGLFLSTVKNT